MSKKGFAFAFIGLICVLISSCTVSYSTSGASISPELKTFSVQYFPNRAPLVNPMLSQQITDALKEKMRSQTRLIESTDLGDASFEGEIVDYNTQPIAIQGGTDQAAKNRLTITIRVKYVNASEPKWNFDSRFSRYEDYNSSQSLDGVASTLVPLIIEQLTEDIFNKAFVNW